MRLLLDTCVCLWLTQEPDRLGPEAKVLLDNPANEWIFSHVSAWEICLKTRAGKLILPEDPTRWISDQIAIWRMTELAIDLPSIAGTLHLPDHHADPFDRLLISQALVHQLTLITPDPHMAQYAVPTIW